MPKQRTSAPPTESSAAPASGNGGNKPVHSVRYRNLKAAIWRNEGQTGPFYSVSFSRSYRDGQDAWHDVNSFNANDLPMLAKLANDCHSWIEWQLKRAKDEGGGQ
jgi:hypothetical protein